MGGEGEANLAAHRCPDSLDMLNLVWTRGKDFHQDWVG